MSKVSVLLPRRLRPVHIPGLVDVAVVSAEMVEVPLLGWVAAGVPVDVVPQEERVAVPADMVRRNTYALRVRGHSMVDDNIQDGDIIIIDKRESAEQGQTVVALINGEQVTLKRFYVERDGIRLQPANPEMAPIYLRNDEVQVLGIVMGVLRREA